MISGRGAVATVACATALTLSAGEARADPGTLPSPTSPVRREPPLTSSQASLAERRFPRRVDAAAQVRVAVDRLGRPVRVVAVSRLTVIGKGDYSLSIPAPVEDVAPAAGSESEPGLRAGGVIWQGFSPERRILAAKVTLRPGAAAAALPLRIRIRTGARTELELRNAAGITTAALASPVPPASLARALDLARVALELRKPLTTQVVPVKGRAQTKRLAVAAPLRVRGVVRFGGGAERVDQVLGSRPLRLAGRGALRGFALTVTVPPAARLLRPPGGRTWQQSAARGRLTGGRATLLAVRRLLEAALAGQFQAFLANPDPAGTTRTTYVYGLSRASSNPRAKDDGGSGRVWLPVAVAIGAVLAAGGALVLWAHS